MVEHKGIQVTAGRTNQLVLHTEFVFMKSLLHVVSLVCLSLCGCTTAQSDESKAPPATPTPATTQAESSVIRGGVVVGERVKGKVVETMDASGYTYASVDVGLDAAVWVVGPQTALKVGNALDIPKGSEMKRFRSKTMNKVFEPIYFVSDLQHVRRPKSHLRASTLSTLVPTELDTAQATGAEDGEAPTPFQATGGHTIADIRQGR